MGRRDALTDEERGRIRGLHEVGWGVRKIDRHVNRAHATVHLALADRGTTERKRVGLEPFLTDGDVRQIIRAAATGNYTTAQLKGEYKCKCSVRAIRRVVARVDWLACAKMERTLPLTPEHMAARREWAKQRVRAQTD